MRGRSILKSLENHVWNEYFSHIYIEEDAFNYEITEYILKKFNKSNVIKIKHYKDIFNRTKQNFILQSKCKKLILAIKRDNFFYEGSQLCHNYGYEHFIYSSTMMNCVYNCEYCFLSGMYQTSNVVVFVNFDDFKYNLINYKNKLKDKNAQIYLSVSFETDLLAFENIVPYTKMWIEFAKQNKEYAVEIRTKSANFNYISKLEKVNNVILSWTLSPNEIIELFEKGTPKLEQRLCNIRKAVDNKWKVRLCFDPLIYTKNFKEIYSKFIFEVIKSFENDEIFDISIGAFRMPVDYFKRIKKSMLYSSLYYFPYENIKGVIGYNKDLENEMIDFVKDNLLKKFDEGKIFI